MTEHTFAALRAHGRCVAGLMADPEVTGDLLLIGLWLARAEHLRHPEPTTASGWQLTDIARDLYPLRTQPGSVVDGQRTDDSVGPDIWKVWEVMKRDIRRYDPWADVPGRRAASRSCDGPMTRRDVCGRPGWTWAFLTDTTTGRRRYVGACRKHTDWFQQQRRANREAVSAAGRVPRPPANAGGLLARHIGLDWPLLWKVLDPHWEPAPEDMRTPARPRLTLLVSPEVVAGIGRATKRFAVIDGDLD